MFTPHRIHGGGVLNFVEVLKQHLSRPIQARSFSMGRRPGLLGHVLRPLFPVYDIFRLTRELVTARDDVYHINPSFTLQSVVRDGLFILLIRMFRRHNILVFFHGWNEDFYQSVLANRLFRSAFKLAFGQAARTMVLGTAFADKLEPLGLPRETIRVISTMFEGGSIQNVSRKRDYQRIWILFMARFVASKGLFELLEAFETLIKSVDNADLILAGDGPEYDRAVKWCEIHAISKNVQFMGYVAGAQKSQLLFDSDIFALPTWHGEGCPISLLEAMGAGLPVVVTGVGGIPDVVKNGVNGIVLRAPNNSAITSALELLVRDPDLRAKFSSQNRKEAWAKYEAQQVISCIENTYCELAKNK